MNYLPVLVAIWQGHVAMSTSPVRGVAVRSVMTCVIIRDFTILSTIFRTQLSFSRFSRVYMSASSTLGRG